MVVAWPEGFVPCDALTGAAWPDPFLVETGRFDIMGYEVDLADGPIFSVSTPTLVQFHAHYWDWAWALTDLPAERAERAYGRLLNSWAEQTSFARGVAWSPYVASLRAWSWCTQFNHFAKGSPHDRAMREQLWLHLRFVRSHLEKDLGGNHLLKNLKAWIALGVFFNLNRDVRLASAKLRRQLEVQILPDGGHYERSPAYHVQVLQDLIDIRELLYSAGRDDIRDVLTECIGRMRLFLGAMIAPNQEVLLLNDGYPLLAEIIASVTPNPWVYGSALFQDTGVARLEAGDWTTFVDMGDPCPEELPGHAHADTLGCLLFLGNKRIVSEAFTSTYAKGTRRSFERSTAAHSTVEIDGYDSTEVWGAFRAGRRARVRDVHFRCDGSEGATVSGWHDGYQHLRGWPIHHRRVAIDSCGVTVVDTITATGRMPFVLRWHLDDCRPGETRGDWIRIAENVAVRVVGPAKIAFAAGTQAVGFEQVRDIYVLEARGEVLGRAVITSRFERWDDVARAESPKGGT